MGADILSVHGNTREWQVAWERLLAVTGDADCEAFNPEWSEVWQYMGTVFAFGPHGPQRWEHQFRHRAHPAHNGARVYVSVPASSQFNRHHDGPDLCECNECIRLLSRSRSRSTRQPVGRRGGPALAGLNAAARSQARATSMGGTIMARKQIQRADGEWYTPGECADCRASEHEDFEEGGPVKLVTVFDADGRLRGRMKHCYTHRWMRQDDEGQTLR